MWPLPDAADDGSRYISVIKDACSKLAHVEGITSPNATEVIRHLKRFFIKQRRTPASGVMIIRTDNGTCFTSQAFENFCMENSLHHELTGEYTPEQNGLVERHNRTMVEGIRALLKDAGLPNKYFVYAAITQSYTGNRKPMESLNNKSPIEVHYGVRLYTKHLRPFGSICMVYNRKRESKLDDTSRIGYMIGYGSTHGEYIVLMADTGRVIKSLDVRFPNSESTAARWLQKEEKRKAGQIGGAANDDDLPPGLIVSRVEESSTPPSTDTTVGNISRAEPDSQEHISNPTGERRVQPPRDAKAQGRQAHVANQREMVALDRQLNASSSMSDASAEAETETAINESPEESPALENPERWVEQINFVGSNPTPESLQEIARNVSHEHSKRVDKTLRDKVELRNLYRESDEKEIQSHLSLGTFKVIAKQPDMRLIPMLMLRSLKYHADGTFDRAKSRLCANGSQQEKGIDFDISYAPVISYRSLRQLLIHIARNKLYMHSMDVSTAYLNANLDRCVNARIPPELRKYGNPNTQCLRIEKAIYGLKQSGRMWHDLFKAKMSGEGWSSIPCEQAIFTRIKDGTKEYMALYVDDILLATATEEAMTEAKNGIFKHFTTKDKGPCTEFLGIEVNYIREAGRIELSQIAVKKEFLETECPMAKRKAETPMVPDFVPPPISQDATAEDIQKYRSLLGSLAYFARVTQPEMLYAVNLLARYQTGPTAEHFNAVYHLMYYLRRMQNSKLVIEPRSDQIVSFTDADLSSDKNRPESTSGRCVLIGGCLVDFNSTRQSKTVRSTTASEVIAAGHTATAILDVIALQEALADKPCIGSIINCDNKGVIDNVENGRIPDEERHIWAQQLILMEAVRSKTVTIKYISSSDNTADMFTKPLAGPLIAKHRSAVGILDSGRGVEDVEVTASTGADSPCSPTRTTRLGATATPTIA